MQALYPEWYPLAAVLLKQLRKLLAQRGDLGYVAHLDVRIVRVLDRVVLVIVLAFVEALQRRDLRHDRPGEHLRRIELLHIRLGHLALLVVGVEDRRER